MSSQPGEYFTINSNGTIFWESSIAGLKMLCYMEVFWFPFDYQSCEIRIGSWSHTIDYLNYTIKDKTNLLLYYSENSEWYLEDYNITRIEIIYDTWIEQKPFSEISYIILLKRRSQFVVNDCVVPAVFLSLLTLLSFFIPFSQQIVLDISIILSYSVLSLRISEEVPVQSESIPLLSIYFTACMGFSLLVILWFTILNRLKRKVNLPKFIAYFIIFYLAKFLTSYQMRERLIIEFCRKYKIKKNPSPRDVHIRFVGDTQSDSTLKSQSSETVTIIKKDSLKHKQVSSSTLLVKKNDFKIEVLKILDYFVFLIFFLIFILFNLVIIVVLPIFVKAPPLEVKF